MLDIGSIFFNKDFIFDKGESNHFQRPCVTLTVKDNYIYFLPITHTKHYDERINFLYPSKTGRERYILVSRVYKKEEKADCIETAFLSDEDIFSLLSQLYFYEMNIAKNNTTFLEIKDIIEDLLKAYSPNNRKKLLLK